MNNWWLKILKVLIAAVIFAWFGLMLAHKIDLTTADLGRHIQNGNIIVNGSWAQKWAVLHTNFYSYTLPGNFFINHHWLSGVVFYFVYHEFGFIGLSVWYVLFGILTLWLFFDIARRASNFWLALASSIVVLPLITSRTEIRPEMFTYFFTGVFFWVLFVTQEKAGYALEKRYRNKLIWVLPLLMLLWVNLHIGFVFGFLVLGAFGLNELVKIVLSRNQGKVSLFWTSRFSHLIYVLIACVIAGLINPSFIKGFLYPLSIFKNYGYLIVENQSIKFLENLNFTQGQHFLLFKIIVGVILLSSVAVAVKQWRKINVAMWVLVFVTAIMSYLAIRNFPSFAFFAIPVLAANFYLIIPKKIHVAYISALGLVVSCIVIFSLSQQYQNYLISQPVLGLGLLPAAEGSANFYKQNNISGPIFNDYDIGSYLVFELAPQKVFVDNRPEAYSAEFFENVYKPAQQDPAQWQALDVQYNFNAIFFSYRDYTPWAQAFLLARVKDQAWAPVFVDSYNIIFLKRNTQNQNLIKQYELPQSMFRESNQ